MHTKDCVQALQVDLAIFQDERVGYERDVDSIRMAPRGLQVIVYLMLRRMIEETRHTCEKIYRILQQLVGPLMNVSSFGLILFQYRRSKVVIVLAEVGISSS